MTIRFDVLVRFAADIPSAAEAVAIRQVDPTLRSRPILEVRKLLTSESKIRGGTYLFSPCYKDLAEAAVGYLRKRGIEASVV